MVMALEQDQKNDRFDENQIDFQRARNALHFFAGAGRFSQSL